MVRLAIVIFALILVVLLVLAQLPQRSELVTGGSIELHNAAVTLYPRSDPAAIWYFSAPTVEYEPSRQEATLVAIEDGRRTLAGETDFTLSSDRLTIDRADNLRGQEMHAHLVADEIDLAMFAKGERAVLIDQDKGRFEVPRATMSGPDMGESVFEDMLISFDFTDFEAGGPGTVGYAQFVVNSPEGAP